MSKRIAIGSDHAGYLYKKDVISFLESLGYEVDDKGTKSEDSCDYPDFTHPVASAVSKGDHDRGVLICGSGNGVSMAANKHENVRAALCWNEEIAELARSHNDANIISIPARFVSQKEAEVLLKAFLETEFEGGRHQRRVEKINLG